MHPLTCTHRYVPERNPACLWLKPNMTEEVLGIADHTTMDGGAPGAGRQPPKRVLNKIHQAKDIRAANEMAT